MHMVKLGDIVEIKKGKKPEVVLDAHCEGSRPCLLIDEVRGKVPTNFTTDAKGVEVSKSDICIIWDGANAGTIGFGVEGLIGSTVARLRIISQSRWDTGFVGRLLQGQFQSINTAAHGKGATIPHVDKRHLEAIEFPAYSLEEQKRVAAILDQADDIRRKRQQAIDRLNQLGQAIFHEMFVASAEEQWPERSVSDLVDKDRGGMRTGPFGSQLLHSEFVEEGIPVLGIDNAVKNEFRWSQRRYITPQKYTQLQRFRVYPKDILITIMGTCGRCAIVPDDIEVAINTKHLCCISLNQDLCIPEYMHSYFLHHPSAQRYLSANSKGAIMDGLNMGIVKDMPVILPPIDRQKYYAKVLFERAENIKQANICLEKSAILFASIQHRAFTGQL
jgi:type I restriction enzyme, S subunit